MDQMNADKLKRYLSRLKKNKYVLLLIAAGAVLLLMSSGGSKKTEVKETAGLTETEFSVNELEKKLESALSGIDGAGKVRVVLTVKSSTEQVLAEDREYSTRITADGTESEESVKVVVTDRGGDESPVTVRYIYPEFQGALIIAEGADDAAVRLALTRAVAGLTDLGSDRITVTKMRQ